MLVTVNVVAFVVTKLFEEADCEWDEEAVAASTRWLNSTFPRITIPTTRTHTRITNVFLVLLLLHIETPLFRKTRRRELDRVWPSRLKSLLNMSDDIKRLYYCNNACNGCFVLFNASSPTGCSALIILSSFFHRASASFVRFASLHLIIRHSVGSCQMTSKGILVEQPY